MNNCLIKIVRSCLLCGVLSLKCDSCPIKTAQRCSPCGVGVVIEKGVFKVRVCLGFCKPLPLNILKMPSFFSKFPGGSTLILSKRWVTLIVIIIMQPSLWNADYAFM